MNTEENYSIESIFELQLSWHLCAWWGVRLYTRSLIAKFVSVPHVGYM